MYVYQEYKHTYTYVYSNLTGLLRSYGPGNADQEALNKSQYSHEFHGTNKNISLC